MDWHAWHDDYDRPDSYLTRRLAAVQQQIRLALDTAPQCAIDPAVRPVRMDELDAYLVAAIDMFIGEVGVDPRLGDGGRGYRRRVAGLIGPNSL